MGRKLAVLALIAVLAAFVVAACSGSEDEVVTADPTATTVAESTVVEKATPKPTAEPTKKPVVDAGGLAFKDTVVAPEGQRTTEVLTFVPVALHIGQKLASPSLVSGLTVDFVEVVEDTRCPVGAECDSPGQAIVRVRTASGVLDTGETSITILGGQTEPTVKKVNKFSIVLISLEPAPVEGVTVDLADYVGTFAVIE